MNKVEESGHRGSVCTIFELREGETGSDAPFHDLDEAMFMMSLQQLQGQGKASVFSMDGSSGVKFS